MDEEIEALYYPDGNEEDKQKACWFPFQKAYNRRRIKPENTIIIDRKNEYGLPPLEESDTADDIMTEPESLGHTSVASDDFLRPPNILKLRSSLTEAEMSSIVTDGEYMMTALAGQKRVADINPNCISTEFWEEEMVESGSFACGTSFGTTGKSYGSNSTIKRGTRGEVRGASALDELSLRHRESSTPSYARIEVEYDFSKGNNKSSLNSRDDWSNGTKPFEKDGSDGVTYTDMSTMSASTLSGKGPIQSIGSSSSSYPTTSIVSRGGQSTASNSLARSFASRSCGSMNDVSIREDNKNKDKSISIEELTSASRNISAARTQNYYPVNPDHSQPTVSNRLLCGAMGSERKKQVPVPQHTANEFSNRDNSILRESIHEDQTEPSSYTDASKDMNKNLCTGSSFMYRGSAKSCIAPECHSISADRKAARQDPSEFAYNVEVEATKRQLDEITDWDEIVERKPPILVDSIPPVEMVRNSSLVDDDSAFKERQPCTRNVFRRFAKRRSLGKKSRAKNERQQPETPIRNHELLEQKTLMSNSPPLSGRMRTSVVRITPEPVASNTPQNRIGFSVGSSNHFHEGRRLDEFCFSDMDMSLASGNSTVPSKSLSEPKQISEKIKRPVVAGASFQSSTTPSHRKDLVRTHTANSQAEESTLSSLGHSKESCQSQGITEFKLELQPADFVAAVDASVDTEDLTTEIGQGFIGDPSHDFEVARFPSLSSLDWKKASMEDADGDELWVHRDDGQCVQPRSVDGSADHILQDSEHISFRKDNSTYLDKSYENAIPFGSTFSSGKKGHNRGRDGDAVEDDEDEDDDSLNTEAFKRLSMEADDEDSIFSGLIDHRVSSGRTQLYEVRKSSELSESDLGVDQYSGSSLGSEDSLEKSRYTSHNKNHISKFPRGKRSFASRSAVSRGDVTAYTDIKSISKEPFNCMDTWLD